jgi:hypothetical protein
MSFRTKDGLVFPDIQTWREHLLATKAQAFQQTFGVPMAQHYTVLSGLDERGLGITSKRYSSMWFKDIEALYGNAGVALIEILTSTPKKITDSEQLQAKIHTALVSQVQPMPAPSDTAPSNGVAGLFTREALVQSPVTSFASLFGATAPVQPEEEPKALPPTGVASLFK